MTIKRVNRHYNKNPQRRVMGSGVGAQAMLTRRTVIVPSFGVPSGSVVTVAFDQDVIYSQHLPDYVSANGKVVESVAIVDQMTAELTFDAAPTGGVTVPFEDLAFRNDAGGHVQDCTYFFPD